MVVATTVAWVHLAICAAAARIENTAFRLVTASIGVSFENHFDFVAHPAENGQLLLFVARRMGRVLETPVMPVQLAREHRAGLIGIAADSDHSLHVLSEKFVHVLAVVAGNINADLGHGLDRQRMDITGGLRPGAAHVQPVSGGLAQNAFRQVATARIAGAKDQDDG